MPKKNSLSIKILRVRLEAQDDLLQQYRVKLSQLTAELQTWKQKAMELEAKVKLLRLVVGNG